MVGGCGILLERGVVGGDGMLDWGNDGGVMFYGDNGAGGISGRREPCTSYDGICIVVCIIWVWS